MTDLNNNHDEASPERRGEDGARSTAEPKSQSITQSLSESSSWAARAADPLPEVEAPSLSPGAPESVRPSEATARPVPPPVPSSPKPIEPPLRKAKVEPAFFDDAEPMVGTLLIPPSPRRNRVPPLEHDAHASPAALSFSLSRLATLAAIAALVGGLAGSLTTFGFGYMAGSQQAGPQQAGPSGPSYDQVFADGLARIDRDLAALKGGVETSSKAHIQQVAKIVERMDRAEKVQADAGTKLAKAGDVLDRVERKLAASNEVTGGLGDAHPAAAPPATTAPHPVAAPPAAAPPPPPEAKRVDGWVLRDVFNGAALIQGHGGNLIEVMPGDVLPGIGRIEAVKRQDGHWMVVTAHGVILPR
jgi:hypothetical protein